jgi:colanic acid biosynthesis glycosyl transferase WcaI
VSRLTDELLALGVDVDVVTTLPWYREHRVDDEWRGALVRREVEGALTVTRLHPFPADKQSLAARALGFAAFTAEAAAWAVVRGGRPDVVFAMSPPLTLGTAGWMAARRWGAPLVFNIQDVFPDAAVASGAITNPRVIRAMSALELATYRRSAAVTVLSEDLASNVRAKLDRKQEIGGRGRFARRGRPLVEVIPNFADVTAITPGRRDTAYRREHDLGDRTVVMYAGNVGWSQPLDLVIEAARRHRHDDTVVFVINGNGGARPGLEQEAAGLPNLRFVDFQPQERLPEVLASADLHLVLLRPGLASASVPSKLYSILAAGRPVLASVDPGTEVERVLADSGGGIAVDSARTEGFRDALDTLLADRRGLPAMGDRGRGFVEHWASPRVVAEQYLALFSRVRSRSR